MRDYRIIKIDFLVVPKNKKMIEREYIYSILQAWLNIVQKWNQTLRFEYFAQNLLSWNFPLSTCTWFGQLSGEYV